MLLPPPRAFLYRCPLVPRRPIISVSAVFCPVRRRTSSAPRPPHCAGLPPATIYVSSEVQVDLLSHTSRLKVTGVTAGYGLACWVPAPEHMNTHMYDTRGHSPLGRFKLLPSACKLWTTETCFIPSRTLGQVPTMSVLVQLVPGLCRLCLRCCRAPWRFTSKSR